MVQVDRPQTGEIQPGEPQASEPQAESGSEQPSSRRQRRRLQQHECEDELASAFPVRKKWWILTVIFFIQTSMNFNTTLYSNGIVSVSKEFQVPEDMARLGAALFLIMYAFGCELWAPWSEEFGRWAVLQISMGLTNICALPVGAAPDITAILILRAFGGLSTAGGSVTFGMVADMYDRDSQQYAIAFVIFSSVFGSILGPIIGGFVELLPQSEIWRWCAWIQLIFGLVVQLVHLFSVPETRMTVMMNTIARQRRESGMDPEVYGPSEMVTFRDRLTIHQLGVTWLRGFKMLFTERIVAFLSLLSGLSDAIIFMQIQSMNLIYNQWGFNCWQNGLAFVSFAVGYLIAWAAMIPGFRRAQRRRDENRILDDFEQFEARLKPMLWTGFCLPLGLGIFAFTGTGPPQHWIWSMFGTTLIGIANYGIYMSTTDYMVCAYGPYAASAMGGNGLARDLLAGVLTPIARLFYTSMSKEAVKSYASASLLLCFVSTCLFAAAVWVYLHGGKYRRQSPFAQYLSSH
ncbi:major facilitator superfamily domain-containing protein [Xylaria sp. FL1042]|nr:major facilitator superfamily domain-containing protein [Xylaria sp. FL1042]